MFRFALQKKIYQLNPQDKIIFNFIVGFNTFTTLIKGLICWFHRTVFIKLPEPKQILTETFSTFSLFTFCSPAVRIY